MKLELKILLGFFFCLPLFASMLQAEAPATIKVTAIVASNGGSDFDLENDTFRDQLIQLFSYKSYKQIQQSSIRLDGTKDEVMTIPGGYELTLGLKTREDSKIRIHALIQKDGKKFLDTEVSIFGTGPVFLGGPPVDSGNLILAVETLD